MEIVLNRNYSSFSISNFAKEKLGLDTTYPDKEEIRTDETLIDLIKKYGSAKISSGFAHLRVYDLPEDMTDYMIQEYDGLETLYYVKDGKIHEI